MPRLNIDVQRQVSTKYKAQQKTTPKKKELNNQPEKENPEYMRG